MQCCGGDSMIKKVIIGIVTTVLVVWLGLYFWIFRYDYHIGGEVIDEYTLLGNQTVVFHTKYSDTWAHALRSAIDDKDDHPGVYMGYQTIILESVQLKESPRVWGKSSLDFGEYWYLNVYTLKKGKLVSKKVDIFDILKKTDPNQNTAVLSVSWNMYFKGKHYVWLKAERGLSHDGGLWINLDDEVVANFSEEELDEISKYTEGPTPFWFSDIGRKILPEKVHTFGREIFFEGTPDDNIALKQTNSKAFELLQSEESYVAVLGSLNLEQSVEIAQLFFPEGTNIFENVTIPAEYSIDGKEHKITTYEEFAKYYKVKKEE